MAHFQNRKREEADKLKTAFETRRGAQLIFMRLVAAFKEPRIRPWSFPRDHWRGRKRLTVVKKQGIFTQGIRLTLYSIIKKERFGLPLSRRSAKKLRSVFWAMGIFLGKARWQDRRSAWGRLLP